MQKGQKNWFKAIHSDSPGAGFESTHLTPKLEVQPLCKWPLIPAGWGKTVGTRVSWWLGIRGLGKVMSSKDLWTCGFLWNAMWSCLGWETLSLKCHNKTLYVWCNRQCFWGKLLMQLSLCWHWLKWACLWGCGSQQPPGLPEWCQAGVKRASFNPIVPSNPPLSLFINKELARGWLP